MDVSISFIVGAFCIWCVFGQIVAIGNVSKDIYWKMDPNQNLHCWYTGTSGFWGNIFHDKTTCVFESICE